MREILNQIGETITIVSVDRTLNDWGDATVVSANVTLKGNIQIMNQDDQDVKAGVVNIGDIVGFFNPSDTNITYLKVGNIVSHDSKKFQITAVINEPFVFTNEYHVEIRAKKI